MRKFNIPCNFNGTTSPFTFTIGTPEDMHHPLHFQCEWLAKDRGGQISQEILNTISKLHSMSMKSDATLEELCTYALSIFVYDETDETDTDE